MRRAAPRRRPAPKLRDYIPELPERGLGPVPEAAAAYGAEAVPVLPESRIPESPPPGSPEPPVARVALRALPGAVPEFPHSAARIPAAPFRSGGAAGRVAAAMPDLSLESSLGGVVCGVDEAGRGPLAGPVAAAAAILDPARIPEGIDDSKRLAPARRAALAAALHADAIVAVGVASVAEIDRRNILGATMLAMRRAVAGLPRAPDLALIDGNRAPELACAARAVVGGDRRSLSIAAASIVAKTRRDRIMAALARDWPEYGWERNAGYPTREHLAALARFGPSPHHRAAFAPVRAAARRRPGRAHPRPPDSSP